MAALDETRPDIIGSARLVALPDKLGLVPTFPADSSSGATPLANLSYDERDVVLLFPWIEFANVFDNRVNQSARRECAMTVQGFDQPMIAGIVEGFGCPVGIEKEGIARE